MNYASNTDPSNHLVDLLPRRERDLLLQSCKRIELSFGSVIYEADQPIRYVYFPLLGFISQLASVHGHAPMEMGMIGNEGMLGASLAFGVDTAPLIAIVQGEGSCLRMSVSSFRRAISQCPGLHRILSRYLYVLMSQLSQTAVCTHFHSVDERLARWLVMTHDRAHDDQFHLTHSFLADMLGVRRSGVTVSAGLMQRKNLIHYSRGDITVLDRPGLQALSCACYGTSIKQYDRLLH